MDALPPPEIRRQLPPDGGSDFNRLIHETSPYLLQHARNPVAWFPWGSEAMEKAKREDKPVFLSIGYSSCHWCHVMEHESFEHEDVAKLLNELCVPVKVDREERPDLDDLYMAATQVMTGRGGWPNSVWLLPDGRPWYAGTYFPREDRGGHPGFKTMIRRLDEVWKTRRKDVEAQADALADAIRRNADTARTEGHAIQRDALRALLGDVLVELENQYDPRHGGFGDAPKFPPHSTLRLLLREVERDPRPALTNMIVGTLDAMQAGGIHDHIGGGFHRYATDARWFLPHFEKMLYDNAQLARVYAEAFRITSNQAYAATARDTFDWVLRDMGDSAGGFHSALDADSEGEEGRFYVWTQSQLEAVLGAEKAAQFAHAYGFTPGGNFQDEATGHQTGANIPFLRLADTTDWSDALARLREARATRVWPFRDDKVLTGWNGLMIGALAIGSRNLSEPRYLIAAERAAAFLLSSMRRDGRLLRSWRDGTARIPGYLDDYAALADGLLDLYAVTGDQRWRDEAETLAHEMVRLFRDERDGACFFSAIDHETLLTRNKDAFDQSIPSGNGLASRVLLRLGALSKNRSTVEQGGDIVRAFAPVMRRVGTGAATLLECASIYLDATDDRPIARRGPITLIAEAGTLRLILDDGWHINACTNVPADRIATVLKADPAADIGYPDNKAHEWRDEIVFTAKIDQPTTFTLSAQPCDATRCLQSVELTLQVVP